MVSGAKGCVIGGQVGWCGRDVRAGGSAQAHGEGKGNVDGMANLAEG